MEFRWNDWNLDHATKHGVSAVEAEYVVRRARKPYPRRTDNGKLLVIGRGFGGRWIQVVYVAREGEAAFVVHARPITDREKKRYRRYET